uniref:C-type lectin domain-containing protein n=1 Tax=Erpetoichthys calabaricus TaxID=27687 RepID=A0A8C4SBL4_ERPCA
MPFRSSCYKIGKDTQIWSAAQEGCGRALPGSHLVNIGMEEEHQFISSYLRSLNHVLMLWTGLNDKQVRFCPTLYTKWQFTQCAYFSLCEENFSNIYSKFTPNKSSTDCLSS